MAPGPAEDEAEEAADAARAMCDREDWWPARACGVLKDTPQMLQGKRLRLEGRTWARRPSGSFTVSAHGNEDCMLPKRLAPLPQLHRL